MVAGAVLTFSNWSMKYESDVQAFLDKHQLLDFNPAAFSSHQCEEMIDLIRRSSEDQKLVNHDSPGIWASGRRCDGHRRCGSGR